MMTPIIDAPAGSPEEYYTQKHCTARNTVERVIRVPKARWRCLLGHRVLHYHPNKASTIINACVVLHNMCNKANVEIGYELIPDSDDNRDESSTPTPIRNCRGE